MTLGEKIKRERRAQKLSQAELANGLFSRSFVSELERNKRKPSAENLKLLANRLGKPISFFISDQHSSATLQVRSLLARANGYIFTKKLTQAKSALTTVLPLINKVNDDLKGKYHKLLLYLSVEESNLRLALEHALFAESLFSTHNRLDQQWECLHYAAHAHYMAGSYDVALRLALRALNLVRAAIGYTELCQITLYQLRDIYVAKGDNHRAEIYLKKVEALGAKAINDSVLACLTESVRATAISDWQSGLAWAEKAERLVKKERHRRLRPAADQINEIRT